MSSGMMLITKSRVAVFNACRRMHWLQYVKGYRAIKQHATAEFGTLLHVGLEWWWNGWQAGGEWDAPLHDALAAMTAHATGKEIDEATMAKAILLIAAYHARWAGEMADLEVLAVECEFQTTIVNPSNGAICRMIRSAGKIDVIVRKRSTGDVWNVEHKSTGADLRAGATYWQRLRLDPQVSTYHRGSQSLGLDPVGTIYDVIVRPDEQPLKATPIEKRKYLKNDPTKLYANMRAEDETMDQFKARMAKAIMDEPDLYLARAEVVRLNSELEAFDRDNYETAVEIRDASRTGRAPRNADSCFKFNRPCDYLAVCDGTASIDDESLYTKSDVIHPELAGQMTFDPKEKGNDNGHSDTGNESSTDPGPEASAEGTPEAGHHSGTEASAG